MLGKLGRLIFPNEEVRLKKRARKTFEKHREAIDRINDYFGKYNGLTEDQLKAKTTEFQERLAPHCDDKAALEKAVDELLPEAFAAVKQACKRLVGQAWEAGGAEIEWDMIPYDVQLAGGIELHRGNIAEMATGEGKTLVAVGPLYLRGLTGKGAHLVTVNDYLAKRDSQWMGRVFEYLGLSVGCILTNMTPPERRKSYHSDITYGTNNEFGFDYLRDNMAVSSAHLVQRPHYYAIVDEVDSVLIDEARTPLIISGTVDRSIAQFGELKPMVSDLVRKQTALVHSLVGDAEELLKEADGLDKAAREEKIYEAGIKLLQSRKAHPKHKRLTKVLNDAANQKLVQQVENDFMRDKRMPELIDDLYFDVDERGHTIDLTQMGREELSPDDPDLFLVPDLVEAMAEIETREGSDAKERDKLREAVNQEIEKKTETIHALSQLLRAFTLYEKDKEYVIQDNKVIIVDEFTGRLMSGRRWSDGLHQAVEAKEGVTVEKETQTLATITLQNYFRLYEKLAGMTGTAISEEGEFAHTYKMETAIIPTNRPIHRWDDDDLIYRSNREKYNAIVEHVQEINKSGMPLLIGTTSVEASEKLSRLLRRGRISHNVLNAKQHEREAQIVHGAGKIGAVTIATNMAGRGTDIKLGEGVVRCRGKEFDGVHCSICPFREGDSGTEDSEMTVCGLQIIGTERHEARRIDRQLRGRSGRQGDPGYSLFYLSLEDDLMRLFASDRMAGLMAKGFEEGEALSHWSATSAIGKAQKKIEDINFEQRKKTLEYDDVMNKQRYAIYGLRRRVLLGKGAALDEVFEIAHEALGDGLNEYRTENPDENAANFEAYLDWIRRHVPGVELEGIEPIDAGADPAETIDVLVERIETAYKRKVEIFEEHYKENPQPGMEEIEEPGAAMVGNLTRWATLDTIDTHWRDHLLAVDELREGIYLRSYGQLNPLHEYQKEATHFFEDMMYQVYKGSFERLFRATVVHEGGQARTRIVSTSKPDEPTGTAAAAEGIAGPKGPPKKAQPHRRDQRKIGPNDPCPCGSGKKYKKCHGSPAARGRSMDETG